MQISNVSSSTGGSGDASQIALLQKKLSKLVQQLKDVATSTTMDAKAKQQQTKLLQTQIAAIQNQITALQNQRQLEQQRQAQAKAANSLKNTTAAKSRGNAALGSQVDELA